MKNKEILDITLYSLTGEMLYKCDRHQRLKIHLRIDDRDIHIMSNNYDHDEYIVIDSHTGQIILIQPFEDFAVMYDIEWLEKECETHYTTSEMWGNAYYRKEVK